VHLHTYLADRYGVKNYIYPRAWTMIARK
jgi:hypothetical protein